MQFPTNTDFFSMVKVVGLLQAKSEPWFYLGIYCVKNLPNISSVQMKQIHNVYSFTRNDIIKADIPIKIIRDMSIIA